MNLNKSGMIKSQWLGIGLVIIILLLSTIFGDGNVALPQNAIYPLEENYDQASSYLRGTESKAALSGMILPPSPYNDNFAPEAEKRQIEHGAYLSLETKQGRFANLQQKVETLIKTTKSILISQDVNLYDQLHQGFYQVKVPAESYDFFLTQAQELATVLSFNDNARDITGQFVSWQQQLEQAKEELSNLQQLFKQTTGEVERIRLQQQIIYQQRYIQELQNSLKEQGDRITYFTVSLELREAPSPYGSLSLVKFSELLARLTHSFNAVLYWLVSVLPWALLGVLVWIVVNWWDRRNKTS